jgi:hypothetical protein
MAWRAGAARPRKRAAARCPRGSGRPVVRKNGVSVSCCGAVGLSSGTSRTICTELAPATCQELPRVSSRREDQPVVGGDAYVLGNESSLAPGMEDSMGQRWRKRATDCIRELQRAAIDTSLPNTIVAYHDAAIFLDHARQAFDGWNRHAGCNRCCALQRRMIDSYTLRILKGGKLSHLSLHCDIGCPH